MAHARLTAALIVGGLTLGACATTTTPSPSMHEALAVAETAAPIGPPPTAAAQHGFGYQAPYMPLVVPPDVRRIWVPTHVTEDGNLVPWLERRHQPSDRTDRLVEDLDDLAP